MIACTLFLAIFTAAKDEKYFRSVFQSHKSFVMGLFLSLVVFHIDWCYLLSNFTKDPLVVIMDCPDIYAGSNRFDFYTRNCKIRKQDWRLECVSKSNAFWHEPFSEFDSHKLCNQTLFHPSKSSNSSLPSQIAHL